MSGFTLIELMIALAVVALLAAVAMPSYHKSVLRSKRSVAATALLDLAAREEKYYSLNNRYTSALTDLGYASSEALTALELPSATDTAYEVTVSTTEDLTSFTGTATPQGRQTDDDCGTFSIDALGSKAVTGTSTTKCW